MEGHLRCKTINQVYQPNLPSELSQTGSRVKLCGARLSRTFIAMTIWSLSMLWLAVSTGVQHDYPSYVSQWQLVLSGADPYSTDNAYGPLHNLLAFLLPLGV